MTLRWVERFGPWAAVMGAAMLCHLAALHAGFVWLDHAHLEHGLAFRNGFTGGFADTGFYRPIMAASLALDRALGGSPLLYHLDNLLLHAAASLAVMLVAERLNMERWRAVVAALLFAVHPLQSLVASAIAFRSEALLLVGLLGMIHAHLSGRALAAGLWLAFACLSKETGLGLAPLFLALLAFPGQLRLAQPRAPRPVWQAETLAYAGVMAVRFTFAPEWRASHQPLGAGQAWGTRMGLVARSLREIIGAGDGSLSDATPILQPTATAALLGTVALAAVLLLAWSRRGTSALFAASLLPLLHFVPVARWWSPHYLYVPLSFLALLLAEVWPAKRWLAWIGVAVYGCFAIPESALRTARFADDSSLFRPEIAVHPEFREAQFYVGEVERARGAFTQARDRYVASLEPRPTSLSYIDFEAAWANLGTTELELGRPDLARLVFQRAQPFSKSEDDLRQLRYDEALATFRMGSLHETIRLLEPELTQSRPLPWALRLYSDAIARIPKSHTNSK